MNFGDDVVEKFKFVIYVYDVFSDEDFCCCYDMGGGDGVVGDFGGFGGFGDIFEIFFGVV